MLSPIPEEKIHEHSPRSLTAIARRWKQAATALKSWLVCAGCFFASQIPTDSAQILWDYPPQLLSTALTFRVWAAGNITLPLTNWVLLFTVQGTNTSQPITGKITNEFLTLSVSNVHGHFFSPEKVINPALPLTNLHIRLEP